MSKYQEYSLEELITYISRGITPKYTEEVNNSAIIINQKCIRDFQINFEPSRRNNLTQRIISEEKKVKLFDILINSTGVGTLGRVAQFLDDKIKEIISVDTHVTIVRPDIKKINPLFLGYLVKSKQSEIESFGIGSTGQTELSRDALKSIRFNVPTDRNRQKEIAEFFLQIDQKIQLNTQINQTLEQIAQALFKSWFVDFDPVRAKIQALSDGLSLEQAELAAMQAISGKTPEELTALSQEQPDRYAELAETTKAFPCEMVKVDGVEVPKGWEVKELGSLMTIKRGGSPRPIKDFISDKGLNWVKISDATAEDNPFLFSTKEYIKSEGLSKTVLLKKGSLILSNSATPGLPRFLELDACIHDGWLYFSDIKSLTQEYLYFFFLNIRNDLVAQGNGSVFTNLKTDIVKAQKAIVPDERVICYFDKQVKSIMNLIRYNTANSISLKETRDLLLPRLLNGEI